MLRFQPFRGVRYDTRLVDLADVTVPPYDVIRDDDRANLAARHVASAVVVDLPTTGTDVYAEAARQFAEWLSDGTLIRDSRPCFYGYRMSHSDEHGNPRHTTGVFGALALSHPGEGGILPHEQTTPKAKSDRLRLMQATQANLSAVWGLSASEGLTNAINPQDAPVVSWTDEVGVQHSFWTISNEKQIDTIARIADEAPVLIADGHHRYETALTYRDEVFVATSANLPGREAVLVYLVELTDDELSVLPIHRLISGLPDDFDFKPALAPYFDLEPAGAIDSDILDEMDQQSALTLVLPDEAWFLVPRADALAEARDLDSSRLDFALQGFPPHNLEFQHGVDHVVERVVAREAQGGFLLRPATVDQIVAIAHGGERMPPKTTFFYPKPRTGVIFRMLDE